MLERMIDIIIYLVSFGIALYGLSAIDFERFKRKGRVAQVQVLYLVLGLVIAYLLGRFIKVLLGR